MPQDRLYRLIRTYFLAVGTFAIWVGLFGYPFPGLIYLAIPWNVPPLHARFIGAMYLGGMVLMAGGYFTLGHRNVRIALLMAALWTGMLLLISLLHLREFDYSFIVVWFWFFAYITFPVAGAVLAAYYRPIGPPAPLMAPGWAVTCMMVQGAVSTGLAALLLFAPSWMATVWPWKISVLLAQLYSGPFLSYGFGALYLALHPQWADWGIAVLAMLAFAVLVLLASFLHLGVFGAIGTAAILWFGGLALASLIHARLCLMIFRETPSP